MIDAARTPDALDAAHFLRQAAGDLDPARGRAHGAALALDRDDLRRLARLPRRVGEILRHDLLAAERDHDHRADVRMTAVRGERVVRHVQIRPELAAAGQVRQRRADRRDRRRDPFGDDRRADDRRHDQHVVAHADAAVGTEVAEKRRPRSHRASTARSPRPRGAGDVVGVHVRAGGDVRRGGADRAAVFHHRLSGADGAHGQLVSARNGFGRHYGGCAGADLAPRVDRLERGRDVVALADDEDGVHWLTPLPSNPPSTASSCPVTNVAASDAR